MSGFIDCRPMLDALLAGTLTRQQVHEQTAYIYYRNRRGRLGNAETDWADARVALNQTILRHFVAIAAF